MSPHVRESMEVLDSGFHTIVDSGFQTIVDSGFRILLHGSNYGIRGRCKGWIGAFLENRSQVVSVNDVHSHCKPVISGISQGSVLGPVLFLLYVNDITDNIKSHMRLFADDSVVYREIHNYQDHVTLEQDLNNLLEWANQ